MRCAKFRRSEHLTGEGRSPKTQGWGGKLSQWIAEKSLSREESCLEEPVVAGSSTWSLYLLCTPHWAAEWPEWLDFLMLDFEGKDYLWCVFLQMLYFSSPLRVLGFLFLVFSKFSVAFPIVANFSHWGLKATGTSSPRVGSLDLSKECADLWPLTPSLKIKFPSFACLLICVKAPLISFSMVLIVSLELMSFWDFEKKKGSFLFCHLQSSDVF